MAQEIYGPENTLRFCWEDKDVPLMGRDKFGTEILIGLFDVKLEEVLCLQDNPRDNGYDLTFTDYKTLLKYGEIIPAKTAGDARMRKLRIINLMPKGWKKVILHMYDPHVKIEDIVGFLKSYGVVNPKQAKKDTDKAGFWTGKWIFPMKFKADPAGHEGLAHPPAVFAIGADRGYLSYFGQPPFCKTCRRSGHRGKDCQSVEVCRFCSSKEHKTKECKRPKDCHACGSTDHVLKDCTERGGAAGGGYERGARLQKTGSAVPSSPAGGGGQKSPQSTGRKEASLKPPTGEKEGARKGSQAFNGNGSKTRFDGGKKVRLDGETEKMDTIENVEDIAGGDLDGGAGKALSFDSLQPSCLFAPLSPLPDVGTLSAMAEGKDGRPPEEEGELDIYD